MKCPFRKRTIEERCIKRHKYYGESIGDTITTTMEERFPDCLEDDCPFYVSDSGGGERCQKVARELEEPVHMETGFR